MNIINTILIFIYILILIFIIINRKQGVIYYTRYSLHITIIFGLILSNCSLYFLFTENKFSCGLEFFSNFYGTSIVIFIFYMKIVLANIYGLENMNSHYYRHSRSSSSSKSSQNATCDTTVAIFNNDTSMVYNELNEITRYDVIKDEKKKLKIYRKMTLIILVVQTIYGLSLFIEMIILFNCSLIKEQSKDNSLWEYKCDYKYEKTFFGIYELLILYIGIIHNNKIWGLKYTFIEVKHIFICIMVMLVFRITINVSRKNS